MRNTVRFVLNGHVQEVSGLAPTTTLLQWLRREKRLTGTKEGCAEGDCGACTVMVSRSRADGVQHSAVNACIQLLPMLEGASVTTVEGVAGDGVAGEGGALHPVQQAMVDAHASQCGFCTPGFVMSLYAMYLGTASVPTPAAIDTVLAGNLCRCTGYGPIVAAAQRMYALPRAPDESARAERTAHLLASIAHDETIVVEGEGQRMYLPATEDELARLYLEHPEATVIAGATDAGLWVTKQTRSLGTMIHVGGVHGLSTIERKRDGAVTRVEIGATVTHADAAAALGSDVPALGELWRRFAGVQVRNAGTVGGNIANGSPIGDLPPALIALGAMLNLRRGDERRTVVLEDFFLAYGKQDRRPGEFVRSVTLEIVPETAGDFACHKISKRFDDDISAVCGAFNIRVAHGRIATARIAFGGMAAVPKRAIAVEAALIGRPWTRETIVGALGAFDADFQPISDARASRGYRLEVAKNLLLRTYLERSHPDAAVHLAGGTIELGGCVIMQKPIAQGGHISGGVGAAEAHDSAIKHVTGQAIYVDDIVAPPGTLEVYLAMSTRAHARVTMLDVSAVRAAAGVVAVLTAKDIPGANDLAPTPAADDPLFADGLVEYYGQSLFAVVADTVQQARAAAKLARVAYEDLPAIITLAQALAAQSYLEPPYVMRRGDVEAALATSPRRLKGQIEIGGQEHFYLEGQAALAIPGEDLDVSIHCSSQHPSEIQHIVAHVLDVPRHAVTVEVRRMGGAFGGKESQGNLPAAAAALAARITRRAVKCVYDRDDDFMLTGKRHDFRIDYDVGFDADGRLLGMDVTQAVRCGMSFDLSQPIADRAMFHADNCYYLPAARITSYRLKTHTQSNTAFRGFGGPQGMVAMERIIDEVALTLGLDPLEVRRRNFYPHRDRPDPARATTPFHMQVEDCIIEDIVVALAESSDYAARREAIRVWNATSPVLKRGIALTPVKFGISFTKTFLNQAGALVHVYADGSIQLNHGGTEMGQGLNTKVAQVVAEIFQVDFGRVKITATHTGKVPNTSATAASSGADLNGMAARNAAETIKARLVDFLAAREGVPTAEVTFLPGEIRVGARVFAFDDVIRDAHMARISLSATGFYATPKVEWDREAARGRPFFYFAYGAAVSEVVIDTLTGENRILRTDILHDVGRSLNPAIDRGQIEGGFVQGAGWLTTEELVWDGRGRLMTHAPSTYKIPACADRPRVMNVALFDRGENSEDTIFKSKAVGEPPLMLGIAVLSALTDAVASVGGYARRPRLDAPATPERILAAVMDLQSDR